MIFGFGKCKCIFAYPHKRHISYSNSCEYGKYKHICESETQKRISCLIRNRMANSIKIQIYLIHFEYINFDRKKYLIVV